MVLPARVMRIPGPEPWKLFDSVICRAKGFDPWKVSFLYGQPSEAFPSGEAVETVGEYSSGRSELIAQLFQTTQRGAGSARILGWENELITVEVERPDPGWAIISSGYYPNWKAEVDGKSAEVLQAQANLAAVFVPAGRSRVSLRFHRPWYDAVGFMVSLISLPVLAAAMLYDAAARRKP